MLIVAALGGNALLPRGVSPDNDVQVARVREAIAGLRPLAADHRIVITHGNGPQVGMLSLESASDTGLAAPYPLDSLVAETQGLIGHWIANAWGPDAVTVLTHVEVDRHDPAFDSPTKFIGPVYLKPDARAVAERYGWDIARDGNMWRRVVPSPEPRNIVELHTIRRLLEGGQTVVCAGGGGIPVVREESELHGVEAVIDKDSTSANLAERLGADLLLILTDVSHVFVDYGRATQRALLDVNAHDLDELQFAAGSMGPKVTAAAAFVRATGARAAIGHLDDAVELVAGTTGTQVVPELPPATLPSLGEQRSTSASPPVSPRRAKGGHPLGG